MPAIYAKGIKIYEGNYEGLKKKAAEYIRTKVPCGACGKVGTKHKKNCPIGSKNPKIYAVIVAVQIDGKDYPNIPDTFYSRAFKSVEEAGKYENKMEKKNRYVISLQLDLI